MTSISGDKFEIWEDGKQAIIHWAMGQVQDGQITVTDYIDLQKEDYYRTKY